MKTITVVGADRRIEPTCAALGLPRATYYRHLQPPRSSVARISHRALSGLERGVVLDTLHEPRFVDLAPAQVHAALLDEETYLCSERTMYRILDANQEVKERRNQVRHPNYAAPQLLATRPNEIWSWDITKLLGPVKWTYYYLYVIMDIFSRYVPGWLLATKESAALAQRLIQETCERQEIVSGQLTMHSDRGPSMTSKPVALFLADLGIVKSLSRPHVSNDNPYSESQFKTLKYRPEFPERFGCAQHARGISGETLNWYNHEHRHSGLGYLTPYEVHYGLGEARLAQRAVVLEKAYQSHPERFTHGTPRQQQLPTAVWINKPKVSEEVQEGDSRGYRRSGESTIASPGASVEVVLSGSSNEERIAH